MKELVKSNVISLPNTNLFPALRYVLERSNLALQGMAMGFSIGESPELLGAFDYEAPGPGMKGSNARSGQPTVPTSGSAAGLLQANPPAASKLSCCKQLFYITSSECQLALED